MKANFSLEIVVHLMNFLQEITSTNNRGYQDLSCLKFWFFLTKTVESLTFYKLFCTLRKLNKIYLNVAFGIDIMNKFNPGRFLALFLQNLIVKELKSKVFKN